MPRKSVTSAATLAASTDTKHPSIFEKNSVEDAETVDILDTELLTAMGFTPTRDQFINDYRVVRVPLLTADVANEAAVDVDVLSVFPNHVTPASATGYTVTIGAAATGLVADTKFVRVRVVAR